MNNSIIEIINVSKKYILGERQPYYSFRDTISNIFSKSFRKQKLKNDEFWALKNVSFKINEGDIVGIIGRNGAGKSTLLKLLSQITPPTSGKIILRGRLASLLEVGTGFHPELTGRENIYLNGAILGMKRGEINNKFKEIVEFSEIEKFIDSPVKHYSSGMYMRLAFAVAAHLDPEILLIDEVLAVGDIAFQKKCLGKMGSIAKAGRTVIFVSHDLNAISRLCTKVIWFEKGKIIEYEKTKQVVNEYIKEILNSPRLNTNTICFEKDIDKDFQLMSVNTTDRNLNLKTIFSCDEDVQFNLKVIVRDVTPDLYGYMEILSEQNEKILVSDSYDSGINVFDKLTIGEHTISISLPKRTLVPGKYSVYLNFTSSFSKKFYSVDSPGVVAHFELYDNTTKRGDRRGGYFSTILTWKKERI